MPIRIEKDGPVWTIVHSRFEARNAMDPTHAKALHDAFLEFDSDDSAMIAILWGEGGCFCAGWDLKQAAELADPNAMDIYDYPATGEASSAPMGLSRLEMSKPVLAAIAGPAVAGGMELALWADMRVMEDSAYMGVYCRRWGVPLIDGGTVRLPRMVGEGRAMDLILTGRCVDAEECLRIGLCEYVVPEGKALEKAKELAVSLTKFPQSCMNADRWSVRNQHGLKERDAIRQEWENSRDEVLKVGAAGAARFVKGAGRSGKFD